MLVWCFRGGGGKEEEKRGGRERGQGRCFASMSGWLPMGEEGVGLVFGTWRPGLVNLGYCGAPCCCEEAMALLRAVRKWGGMDKEGRREGERKPHARRGARF